MTSVNPSNIEGILQFAGFEHVTVEPKLVIAHATLKDEIWDFWVQDGKVHMQPTESFQLGSNRDTLSYSIDDLTVEEAFQKLIDFFEESNRELEEEGYEA